MAAGVKSVDSALKSLLGDILDALNGVAGIETSEFGNDGQQSDPTFESVGRSLRSERPPLASRGQPFLR